jgi:ABC-2 type transport system permease protein
VTRTLVVARAEFLAIVRGKAFVIGVLMAPVLIGLSIAFQVFADRQGDVADHRVAVIDRSGTLYDALERAAADFNRESTTAGRRTGPMFHLERVAADAAAPPGTVEAMLSDRVRARDLFAFVDIPASLVDPTPDTDDDVRYYTETPSYNTLPNWLRTTIEREATSLRFASASLDAAQMARLSRAADLTRMGLVSQGADGSVTAAQQVGAFQTIVLPFALMYLLFVALMSAAPQLLTAVVEEKMSRISEVLLASVSPGQLMAGKLLGVSGVATLLALVYVVGGVYMALQAGQFALINVALLAWFVVFLLVAVLMYGAIFIAVGSACSDLKDSQSMMQPIMIFLMLPLLAAPVILRSPDSTLSVVLSLVPTATPFLMLVRLALTPPPPLWQVILSLVLTAIGTAALVWVSGRIFRVGLLMQGKPPNLPELLRWIRQ